MTIQEVTNTVHSLGNAWEQFKHVNDTRLNEIERKGRSDPLHTEQLNKLQVELDYHKQRANVMETANSRPALAGVSHRAASHENCEYRAAFCNYLRKGTESGLEQLQFKTLSVTPDQNGGFFVTPSMSDTINQVIRESSPMRQLASIETISTDTLDVIDDTGEMDASWIGESDARPDTNDPVIARRSFDAFEMYAQPKATQKLIDDSSVDIENWVAQKIADKFARLEATAFVAGDGVNKPRGILSYAVGTAWGQIEQVASGTAAVVTADSLFRLYYSLKDAHARQASFLMHRNTVQQVRLLKEATTNQYLWQPGLTAGQPDILLGAPVVMAADMPVAAASSLSIAVGDFKRGYLIVDRAGVRTLRDPFTAKPFVKFYSTKRVGGGVLNFDAIKLLRLSA
jgi:HK97 family phage major capsid protein